MLSPGRLLLRTMRAPFLILTPACVFLGLGTALQAQGRVDWLHFVLVMLGALAAHISVNTFNEYFDFKSGLDARTRRTPFSGGSGTLPARPEAARATLWLALATLGAVSAIGVYFTVVQGPKILPVGALGLLIVAAYTPWVTKSPILCLLAPGLGFGPAMVLGTHFALTGSYSWMASVASLVPFFLVNDLLLLNQFPDADADRTVGRRHLPIAIGRTGSSYVYIAFLLAPFAVILAAAVTNLFPLWSLIGLLPLALAVPLSVKVAQNAETPERLIPQLAQNVLVNLLTPVLVFVGLIIG